jgi:O-antigen/teichoic acid export membrane protein
MNSLQSLIKFFSAQGAKQGYLAATDQGLISITNFLSSLILARELNPTEFGVYAVGFLLIHFIRAIQDGLIIQPLNAFGAIMPFQEFRKYTTGNGIIQLGLAIISVVAAIFGGLLLNNIGYDTAGLLLLEVCFAFFFWQVQEYIRRTFYTRNHIHRAVINTALASVVRLTILGIWAWKGDLVTGGMGLDAIAWSSMIATGLGLWQARQYWFVGTLNLSGIIKQNWRYGRWVMGGSLANWVTAEVYPIMAAGLVSLAAAGAYRALQNLVAPVHVLLRATDTFFTPRAARLFNEGGYSGLGRILRLIYLLSGIPILGLLVIAAIFPEPLLGLLYGETYLPYSNGLILMAIYYGLWYAYWPIQAAFKAVRLTQPIFIANGLAILSMFTVGVWAIHRWGVYGAIGGQALNASIVTIFLWISWFMTKRKGSNHGRINHETGLPPIDHL